jgi:hypothetical protein
MGVVLLIKSIKTTRGLTAILRAQCQPELYSDADAAPAASDIARVDLSFYLDRA